MVRGVPNIVIPRAVMSNAESLGLGRLVNFSQEIVEVTDGEQEPVASEEAAEINVEF